MNDRKAASYLKQCHQLKDDPNSLNAHDFPLDGEPVTTLPVVI
jgi:hypothetical protein